MGKAPAFQLYAQDFDMDTASWSSSEVGIYMRLLMYEWVNGALPNDMKSLARICRMDGGNFSKCWCPNVKGKFTINAKGELTNRRLEEEREKQLNYRESQTKKGKIGNAKRWGNDRRGDSNGDGNGDRTDIALQSSSSSSTSKPKVKNVGRAQKKRATPLTDEEFIKALKANPAYKDIDFDKEMGKLDAWLLTPRGHGKRKTHARILNWLNKCERGVAPLPNKTRGGPTCKVCGARATVTIGRDSYCSAHSWQHYGMEETDNAAGGQDEQSF